LMAAPSASGQEPRSLINDVDARPLNEVEQTNTLRWKTKPAVTELAVSPAVASQPIDDSRPIRAGWNITRIDTDVRPVQHTPGGGDPFTDPFGDRKSAGDTPAAHGEPLLLQPTQAETGVEELPAPRPPSRIRHAAPTAAPESFTAQQGSGIPRDPNRISPAVPGTGGPLPLQGTPSANRSQVPCDRIYNDRNCCEVDLKCHTFRDNLLADSIRKISLDITPPYNPDPQEDESALIEAMRNQLTVRQWHNRRGEFLATGKMIGLQNNAVVLSDENGKEVARLPIGQLAEDELCYVNSWWRLPAECPLGGRTAPKPREWIASSFNWTAPSLCHKPLYFEEVQLERYGHTAGPIRQPFISGAHFVINTIFLPYKMAINPPQECWYTLGYYRPGNCAPWMIPPVPLSVRGAAAEIAAAVGFVYLIP
jgi:hypothetical protein